MDFGNVTHNDQPSSVTLIMNTGIRCRNIKNTLKADVNFCNWFKRTLHLGRYSIFVMVFIRRLHWDYRSLSTHLFNHPLTRHFYSSHKILSWKVLSVIENCNKKITVSYRFLSYSCHFQSLYFSWIHFKEWKCKPIMFSSKIRKFSPQKQIAFTLCTLKGGVPS